MYCVVFDICMVISCSSAELCLNIITPQDHLYSSHPRFQVEEDVYRRENDLIEIQRQMDIVTPRAMEAGFLEECEKNAVEIREDLTKLKVSVCYLLCNSDRFCMKFVMSQVYGIFQRIIDKCDSPAFGCVHTIFLAIRFQYIYLATY